ncbi:668_t:CDS:1, partial [Cetraspora pellucida]
ESVGKVKVSKSESVKKAKVLGKRKCWESESESVGQVKVSGK